MQVTLVNPQIPQNTGAIARTCAATNTPLNLIKPYPFEINEKNVRRAGLDYWPFVDLTEYDSWQEYLGQIEEPEGKPEQKIWLLTTKAVQSYWDVSYQPDDILIFGSETTGLSEQIRKSHPERCITIPMYCDGVRSLNLANATSIVLYEALRQNASSLPKNQPR